MIFFGLLLSLPFFSLAQANGPVSSDFFGRSPCSENLFFLIFFGDFSKINIAST
jgi:hypothetical protein